MITKQNILLVIFSFNRNHELITLLESIKRHCTGYDILIIDDASTLPSTPLVIQQYKYLFQEIIMQPPVPKTTSRGRLPENIQFAYEYGIQHGYEYLFFIQDDMQFIRPFDEPILKEYGSLFERDRRIIQIDPRFLRRLGTIEIFKDLHAYGFPEADDRSAYADVGILKILRLKKAGWIFEQTERKNKEKAHTLGFRRIFPFTPVFMHVPYPVIYRKGQKKMKFPSPLLQRGKVAYEYMTLEEMSAMDSRDLSCRPYAKDMLRVRGLGLAKWHYLSAPENKIFC